MGGRCFVDLRGTTKPPTMKQGEAHCVSSGGMKDSIQPTLNCEHRLQFERQGALRPGAHSEQEFLEPSFVERATTLRGSWT